jgi:2-dehydro-3-deoxygalactonokinase
VAEAVMLGVDWGSSSMRALRIAADGQVLDVRRNNDGVFTASGDFGQRLRAQLGDWLAPRPDIPVVLCGMVGSDRGWIGAPYVDAPASVEDLARALATPPFAGTARIVPGVKVGEDSEVMRGEETLVMGLAAQTGLADATLCLPGTHSKWVRLRGGRIDRFRTYMTGELRALLLAQGALATGVEQVESSQAFRSGLKSAGAALSGRLFQARARRLLGQLAAEHTASFVSGVLIGEEVAAERMKVEPDVPVFVAARGALADAYGTALYDAGMAHTIVDPEPLAALGLLTIARSAGLLDG